MRRPIRRPLVIRGITVFLLLVAISSLAFFWTRSETVEAADEDSRLRTVYDRGESRVILSEAATIGDALRDAGIQLDTRDAVEPAVSEALVAREYQVNIYRARPVIVVDGPLRQKIMTPYQSAERIARDAGLTLYSEDTTSVRQVTDLLTDGAGLEMIVDRATPLTLTLHGSTAAIRTQATTVAGLLEEKGISIGADDKVSTDLTAPITADMQLRVWREGKQTLTTEEPVAFPTEQIRDADREIGYRAVQTPGQDGRRTVTYEITIQDGTEVARTEITSLTTRQPVKQVEVIGVKSKVIPYTGGGSKTEWLSASVVPRESWGYADSIVTKESGWNPNATNRSSGACGLAQALPCSKVPGNPYNPVDSLNWMNGYVNGRYGGWEGAYAFWQKNRWY